MNGPDFEAVFEDFVSRSREVLIEKAAQYANDDDRMRNFKRGAALMNCTPEQALWGYLVKHLISIQDMVQKGGEYPEEVWDEKLGDAVNYLILLRALTLDDKDDSFGRHRPTTIINQTIVNESGADPSASYDLTIPPHHNTH